MAAVTQTIPTYLGGVSKQIDSKKKPGQVRECLNAYPDPTFGLMKRPGTKFIKTLATTALTDAKWFYIHRDGDEQYVGRISKGNPGDIKIWNAVSGVECTVTDTTGGYAYLQPAGGAADNPQLNYDILTVQDTTIITNKTKPVSQDSMGTHVANKKGTVRLKQVRYGSTYSVKINGTQMTDHVTVMSDANNATEVLNSQSIIDALESGINGLNITGMTVTKLPSSLELSCTSAFTLEAIDKAGGANLEAFQEQVNVITDLPNQCANGRLIKVINTEETSESSYWAKFRAEGDAAHGPGFWEETRDPTSAVSIGLNNTTMPHELFNPSVNTFQFKVIDWKDRLVGDNTTNEHPSFCDPDDPKTIQQCFLYNTRLGFLTKDNVSLSQAQDYYNFYFTTALSSLASDPIDLSCSSIRPAVLHGVVPTAQGLVLFSKNQQFMMFAADGPLTPASAIIRSISNYEMDTHIDPVDVGTNINFVSKTPSYSRIFGMQTRGYEESPIIQDISRAVSQWIPESIDNIFASPQNSLTGVYGKDSDKLYLYRVYAIGKEELMQSWFEWKLPGKIQHCTIDNDNMWTVILDSNDNTVLLKSSISKSTTEDIIVTKDGLQVNPHMDMFTPASSVKYKEVTGFAIRPPSTMFPGYTTIPELTISPPADPNGVTATATCKVVGQNGVTAEGYDQLWWGGDTYVDAPVRSIVDVTITNPGSGYTSTPFVEVGKPWEANKAYGENDQCYGPTKRVYQCVTSGGGVSGTTAPVHGTIYNYLAPDDPDENSDESDVSDGSLMWRCMGLQGFISLFIDEYDGSRCYLPYEDITELNTVILVKGSGVTESGFTITPERKVDDDGNVFFGIPKLNFTPTPTDIYVGYEYNYDVELPKTYYKLPDETVDYAANLTIARMKFAVGLSSGVGFKLKSKGYVGDSYSFVGTADSPTDNSEIGHWRLRVPFPLNAENGVTVKVDGAEQLIDTAYTIESDEDGQQGTVVFKSGYIPTKELPNNDNTVKPAQTVEVTTGTWYDVQPVQDANQYLADDVPLTEENTFTIPIHQRTDNFNLRVFSNSPFPVSLNSMMWEGNYSRYYRRT